MTANKTSIEATVAIICEIYHLDAEAAAEVLQNIGYLTPEQRIRVGIICSAFKAKEAFESRTKGKKS